MKYLKYFLVIALSVLVVGGAVQAYNTLYEFYTNTQGSLPSISERSVVAGEAGILNYTGTVNQNKQLLDYLQGGNVVGSGEQFYPSQFKTTLSRSLSSTMSSSTTLYVSSVTTKDGHTLATADFGTSPCIPFSINQGSSNEEIVICTGVSGSTFTGCTRGYKYYADATETNNVKSHSSGESVIITNHSHCDSRNVVGTYNTQTIPGTKTISGIWTFNNPPKAPTVTTLATTSDQYVTKYYADNVTAGGFTAANVGTSAGLTALGTAPETVGIDLDTQSGLEFNLVSGDLGISFIDSSSAWTGIRIGDDNYLRIATSSAITWGGAHRFSGTDTHFTGPVYASSTFQVTGNTILTGHSTTTGSMTVGGTLATGDDGFISTVSGSNEGLITIPSGARKVIIQVTSDSCNADCSMEMNLTSTGKTSASVTCGYYNSGEASTVLTATTTAWTTIGYSATGANCGDGTDAQAWFFKY